MCVFSSIKYVPAEYLEEYRANKLLKDNAIAADVLDTTRYVHNFVFWFGLTIFLCNMNGFQL